MEESDYFLSNLKSKCQLLNDRYLIDDENQKSSNQKSNENQPSNENQENNDELMYEKEEEDKNQPPSLTSHLSSKNNKKKKDHQRIQDTIEFHHDQDQPTSNQPSNHTSSFSQNNNHQPTISPLSPSQLFTYGSSSFISSHSSSRNSKKRQKKKKCTKRDSNQRRQLIGIPKKYHSSHIASKHLKDQFHITDLSSRIRKGNFQDDNIYLPALSSFRFRFDLI